MPNIAKAIEEIESTQKLLAERYNEQLYRFESPVNDHLKGALAALRDNRSEEAVAEGEQREADADLETLRTDVATRDGQIADRDARIKELEDEIGKLTGAAVAAKDGTDAGKPDSGTPDADDLSQKTKDELVALAGERKVDIKSSDNKAELIEKLKAATPQG